MKKIILFSLILVAAMGVSGFVQSEKSAVESVKSSIEKGAYDAPVGTTYGVVQSTKEKYVVNTPIGQYEVKKSNGGFSFMGLYAKIVSRKGSVYNIESSVGNYEVNIRKCTIVKKSNN